MPSPMKFAFTCHSLAAALLVVFGFVYLFRPEFMPYHADAIARDWGDVEEPFQVLILALMRVAGGGWVASATAIAILLLVPFRQGLRWARWAIPVVGLLVSAPALYATAYVRRYTPAEPPWLAALAGMTLLMLGFVSSLVASRRWPISGERSRY